MNWKPAPTPRIDHEAARCAREAHARMHRAQRLRDYTTEQLRAELARRER